MIRVRSCLFFISLAVAVPALAGEIYQWTDSQGRVHFGDRPPDAGDGQPLEVQPNVMEAVPLAPAAAPRREVVLYSTQRCGFCRKARAHFRAHGIPFTEYDVETTDRGARDFRRLGGRGVPIILIGDERMDGFSAPRFDRLYRQP